MIDLNDLLNQPWPVLVVVVLLAVILVTFPLLFVLPAIAMKGELTKAIKALDNIKRRANGVAIIELDEIKHQAMSAQYLSHLWSEYAKTLHEQREEDAHGHSQIVRWRSTALAETFFSDQTIVDNQLKTEFYKHLPGILTGLGIIGTFGGLISGLNQFDVSLDPTKAQEQLRNLVNSVGHAFIVSGFAISLAMFFTWIEKLHVVSLYRQVESLREGIDSLFKGGAGEEYLDRLVAASESSSTHVAHIRDTLVSDLKEVLTALTNQQIEAQAQHTGQMSVDVGKAITESLSGPMQAISKAVENATTDQGDAVTKMLTDVLVSFSSQMRDMFGGQMQGMSDLLRQTSESMKETAIQFGQLAANMDSAGTGAVDAMGERMNKALEAIEARQQVMNTQMSAFVEQIKALVSESQSESSKKLQEVLGSLGEQVAGVVAELRIQAEASAESQGARQQRFEQTTSDTIGSLSGQVEQLLSQSMETNKSLQNTVANLAAATDKAMISMNSGAETLFVAASDFAKAGQGVADTMRASTAATESIKIASSQLSSATEATRKVLEDYAQTRDTFAVMVSELKLTIENAKREASMSSEIIKKIEAAAQQLAIAQQNSEDYLRGVTEVLVKAHESFGQNVALTLREGNRQFQQELSSAVGLLSGAIKNLGDLLGDIPTQR